MTNIQKVLTSHFGSLEIDVVQAAGQPEPGITRRQLGEMLGYEDPINSIQKIHNRNKKRLDQFSGWVNLSHPEGGTQEVVIYNFKGILEVCRY